MTIKSIGLTVTLLCVLISQSQQGKVTIPYKRYLCEQNVCVLQPYSYACAEDGKQKTMSLSVCRMSCGSAGSLWPIPTGKTYLSHRPIPLSFSQTTFDYNCPSQSTIYNYYEKATHAFKENVMSSKPRMSVRHAPSMHVELFSKTCATNVPTARATLQDEAYTLHISSKQRHGKIHVKISSSSCYGVRHGLETLSQLIALDESTSTFYVMSDAHIEDTPKYPHRGILLDTSRNFFPMADLKHLVKSMSYSKLNVLHWHLSDTASFPLEVESEPRLLSYGAYSPKKYYSRKEVVDFIAHARYFGVKVLPEIDTPSHVGHGWEWGEKEGQGVLAVCVDAKPWTTYCVEPPCGQLNPINENIYHILEKIYREILENNKFSLDIFHMGGDEVHFGCWNSSEVITDWMEKKNMKLTDANFLKIWQYFQDKNFKKLTKANNAKKIKAILWTSKLTDDMLHGTDNSSSSVINKEDYIIQLWNEVEKNHSALFVKRGYEVILSNYDAWYLDCGFGSWVSKGNSWCNPYKSWQLMYDAKMDQGMDESDNKDLVLGGEAAMWSEIVGKTSYEMKIWPRAAAVAERLWSNPTTGWYEADDRMQIHRTRLVDRGVQADVLQTYWCLQNQGLCSLKPEES